MAVAQTAPRLSEREYLAIERVAEFKSEFFNGEMFAMAGGSPMHSLIATNLTGEARTRLKGRPCVPFNSDLRLKVQATGLYTYPDLSVICGPLEFADEQDDVVINPTLIAEVLSDSTEAYDRGKKFEHYRQIPTLQEYLLVSQREARIEQFIREKSGDWRLREAVGMEAQLELPSLKVTIALAEVYANVKFESSTLRPSVRPPA